MAEMSVLELVEAFNQAQADIEAAKANAAQLEAENARLEPFEARVAELEAQLEVSQGLHREASAAGTGFADERDAAIKAQKKAEKDAAASKAAFEDLNTAFGEVKDELSAAKARIEELEGQVRTLEAFEAKARPVFEASEALRAALG